MGTHDGKTARGQGSAWLREDPEGLTLTDGTLELRADLSRMAPRIKPGRLSSELLVKAAKVKGAESPLAIDATAGLGEDALLLAAAGFRVILYERDAVIAALLRDALVRAAGDPLISDAVARMTLVEGDSVEALNQWAAASTAGGNAAAGAIGKRPDVILLDPMFPERQKSAAVKKKFQLIHQLERPCDDEEALLGAARAARPRKIVIKRPPKGPYLAGVKPAYSLTGKTVRYDCLVLAND